MYVVEIEIQIEFNGFYLILLRGERRTLFADQFKGQDPMHIILLLLHP